MGELQEAAKWERVGAVETRQEKMEKLLWSGARGVGMVKPVACSFFKIRIRILSVRESELPPNSVGILNNVKVY